MKKELRILVLVVIAVSQNAISQTNETKLTWFGHSAFRLETPEGHILWIDPWLSNPLDPIVQKNGDPLSVVDKADYIVVTHGHFDHVGEAVQIAKKTHARLVTSFDLAQAMIKVLKFPADQVGFDTMGGPGGELSIADSEVKITFIQAVHSSSLDVPGSDKTAEPAVYGGEPISYVIQVKHGPTIYDSGDTAYFSDMKLVGEKFHPDLAILNIGGHFGMEVPDAIRAAKDVGAKLTIPQHYKTFPVLTQSADGFIHGLENIKLAAKAPEPGETIVFQGNRVK